MTTAKEKRALHVAQMRAHLAKECDVAAPEKEALLDRFVEGTAALADIFNQAREYVTTAQEREDLQLTKEHNALAFQRMREQYAAGCLAYEEEKKQKNLQRAGMSIEQRQRHEALDFARTNVELSGGKISEEDAQRALRWANGEISMDEYLESAQSKIAPT